MPNLTDGYKTYLVEYKDLDGDDNVVYIWGKSFDDAQQQLKALKTSSRIVGRKAQGLPKPEPIT